MDRTILNDIQATLLQPTIKTGIDLIIELIQKIQNITGCSVCSLWSINSNDYNENPFKSTSLIYRQVSNGIYYDFIDKEDFVHDMGRCFINDVVRSITSNKSNYHECDISGCTNHRSKKCIDSLHLCYFIGIPIFDHDNTSEISAILKLSYQIKPKIDCWNEIAVVIGSFLSLLLYRNSLLKKQRLIKLLMDNYRDNCKTGKNIKALFKPIINNILPLFCKCQGVSFFIWDSYQNRFNLLESTGIKGVTDSQTVFYQLGEGLTGLAGMRKRTLIYNNLEEERENSDHKEKWIEDTLDIGETMMIVPILSPSGDNAIGLLRLVNKVNFANEKFIDYFNDRDVDLMSFASNYIALSIDYLLRETSQNDFITKLSHEFYTPALSIHKTADQIKRYKDDEEFMKTRFQSYIQDIIYYAEFQQWQATTNLYLSKNRLDLPFDKRYRLTDILLKNIITKSKSIAIPIARKVKVKFDNIVIDDNIPPVYRHVDETAFVTIFYNLLTNAIKYNDPTVQFYVNISAYETDENIVVTIVDYGIGIDTMDANKIFQVGYRGENVTLYNTNGFGVGLPVVKQIIEDFNGTINILNYHSPTKFEIKFPKSIISK